MNTKNTQNEMVSRAWATVRANEAATMARRAAHDAHEKKIAVVAGQIAAYMGQINSELIRMDRAVDKALAAVQAMCGPHGSDQEWREPGPGADLPEPVALSVEYIAGAVRSMADMSRRIEMAAARVEGCEPYPEQIAALRARILAVEAAACPGPVAENPLADQESDDLIAGLEQ